MDRLRISISLRLHIQEVMTFGFYPSITDGVHRNENLVEIIPVFSTFSNFFNNNKKKNYKSHFM